MADTAEAAKPFLRFTLEGLGSKWDGEYEFMDLRFTNRELHTIKKIANVRGGEIDDALRGGDQDLAVAFAYIALERAGRPVPEKVLWDADSGFMSIVEDEDEEETKADPLASTPDEPSEPSGLSGTTSEPSSDSNPSLLSGSGDPGSDTPESPPE